MYVVWRVVKKQPILPNQIAKALGLSQRAGAVTPSPTGEDLSHWDRDLTPNDAGTFQFDDATAGDLAGGRIPYDQNDSEYFRTHGLIPLTGQQKEAARQQKGWNVDLSFFKEKAVPIAIGASAAGATIAAQRALARAKKLKVSRQTYGKEKSGLIKRSNPTKVSSPSSSTPKKVGTTLRSTQGTGTLRTPTTVQRVAARPLVKVAAVTRATAVVPKAGVTGLKVLGAAGRVAGRVFLPLTIGLAAYDIADRARQKGAQNLTAQDVAAAGTGLGGLGLSKYLPEQVRGALGTKLVDVPNSINTGAQTLGSNIAAGFSRLFGGG